MVNELHCLLNLNVLVKLKLESPSIFKSDGKVPVVPKSASLVLILEHIAKWNVK